MCKFTPLGFETAVVYLGFLKAKSRVNLPRWGLKLREKTAKQIAEFKCKFTPLGFETRRAYGAGIPQSYRVNLPRWGLKPVKSECP